MAQEIGIKLKADTSEATKNVQDFERTLKGMENMESKGNAADGFLSRKDVEEFKRLSEEAERIHRNFQEKLDRSARELDKKREELGRAQERGAGSSTTDNLKRQVEELEAQQAQYQQAQARTQQQQQRYESTQQTVGNFNTEPTGGMGNIYALGNQGIGSLAGLLGGAFVFSQMNQGMNLIRSEEEYSSAMGQRIPGVGGDFKGLRESAGETGLRDGTAYTAQETLQTADTYTSLAGATSAEEAMEGTNQIQVGSRTMGVDPNLMATTVGSLQQSGALDVKTIKAFQEGMVGAIKQTGMDGRDAEFTQAVSGLAASVGRGQTTLDNGELNQLLGLQTILGESGHEGLKGQAGADVLASMDAAVKGGDNRLDLMLGWGTDFQGLEGRAELERFKAGGISNPELMSKLMNNMNTAFGGDKDQMALFMTETMGVTMEQADALLEDKTFNQLKDGSIGEEKLKSISELGKTEFEVKSGDWEDSDAQRRAENTAENQETQRTLGTIPDAVSQAAQEIWNSLPPEIRSGLMLGGAVAAPKILKGGMGMLKKAGPKVGDTLKGGAGSAGGKGLKGFGSQIGKVGRSAMDGVKGLFSGGKGSGLLKTGRFLGPLGTIAMGVEATKPDDGSLMDSIFGMEEGELSRKAFREDPEAYYEALQAQKRGEEVPAHMLNQESKDNIIKRAWNSIFGGDEEKEHGGGALTEDEASMIGAEGIPSGISTGGMAGGILGIGTNPLIGAQDPNNPKVNGEGVVLNSRRALQDEQAELLKREKDIIDERKGLLGMGGFGTASMLGIDGAGGGGAVGGGGGMLGAIMGTLVETLLTGGGAGDGEGGSSAVDGGDLTQQSLKASNTMTAEEIDEWINKNAPEGSIMRGQGAAFAKAAQESGLDARYLVSHAAHETGWGTSQIARDKGNMYGIGAFDATPYASAYGYNGTEAGIIEGAKWISQNYTNKGQDTLESMRFNNGVHEYATDPEWHTKIANIMRGAGAFGGGAVTQRLDVVVSGSIDNLTAENNNEVAQALKQSLLDETQYNLGRNFRQGVGGDR